MEKHHEKHHEKHRESRSTKHHTKHAEHHDKPHAKPAAPAKKHVVRYKRPKEENILTKPIIVLCVLAVVVILFNQFQLNSLSKNLDTGLTSSGLSKGATSATVDKKLASLDVSQLKSTGHTIAAVFPVENIKTSNDAISVMFPTGTPSYGTDLGVSYDDPVSSLSTLAKMYRGLKVEVQKNKPEAWKEYMALASKPVGISCEYCCGIGPVGINKDGDSACGCQHNPALLSVALYLTAYSDYSEGEILLEVMKWKTLFFPKKMIETGISVAGGDTSKLDNLPGMVGGC